MKESNHRNSSSPGSAWRYFGRFYAGQKGKLAWTTAISAAQTLLIIPTLLLVKYAFDKVIPAHDIRLLILIGIAIFLLRLVNSVVSVWVYQVKVKIINLFTFRVRGHLLARLYDLSHLFYARTDIKILHARIVQDTERLGSMSNALISRIMPSTFISLGLLVVLFFLNWYLLLIILALGPLLFLANRLMGEKIRGRVVVFQRAFEGFSKGVFFVLRFMDLTTIQSAQDIEMEKQLKMLGDLQQKTSRMALIYAVNVQLQEVLTGLSAIVIIIIGGVSVATGSMTLGGFLSFYLAAIYLNKYINTITGAIPEIISGHVSLTTLYDLVGTKDTHPYTGTRKIDFTGEIRMKGVSFSYNGHEVLKSIDLDTRPGMIVAIIGPNGSGKTTLLNLMAGLFAPVRGEITADHEDYHNLDMAEFRKHLGVVVQHPPLFSGTIEENITYGAGSYTHEEVILAAGLALAHDFIEKLPAGYETQIGEDGVLLSGGECQRIAIARALIRKPKLLILDEPTNHLDKSAVDEIMERIGRLADRPAVVMISHDRGVIGHADEIYELKEGMLHPFSQAGKIE